MNKEFSILVLDDDPDLGTIIKLMLVYEGYTVSLSEKSEEITEILRNKTIDLIIMDMLLSGANGKDLCSALKQDDNTQHIPIMMISAHPNAKEICLAAGADDFISKPFDMDDLLSRVNLLITQTV